MGRPMGIDCEDFIEGEAIQQTNPFVELRRCLNLACISSMGECERQRYYLGMIHCVSQHATGFMGPGLENSCRLVDHA